MNRGLWNKLKTVVLQLPREVAQDLPKLTLSGMDELHLRNHKGVARFEPTVLCVRTSLGEICVTGADFSLKSMGADLLLLRGRIDSIRLGGQEHA